MATGTRTTDTFTEGLRKLLSGIQDLKTTDDADLPFIINLETVVLQRLKQTGTDALQGTPSMAGGAGPMMPGMGAGPPGMAPPGMGPPPAGPGIAPAPVPGLMAGPSMPNPDELRRLLGTGNTALRLNNVASKLAGM